MSLRHRGAAGDVTLRLVVALVVALGWALPRAAPARAVPAHAPANNVYVADFTGSFNAGNPQAAKASGISGGLTQWLATLLEQKYPCATVDTAADYHELLNWERQRELLGGETPEQQGQTLENIAKDMGNTGTFVYGSYAVVGSQYTVFINVMDAATAQVVDRQMATVKGSDASVMLVLVSQTVGKLSVALCNAHWTGSITITTTSNTSTTKRDSYTPMGPSAGKKNKSTNTSAHQYRSETSLTLLPPKLSQQSGTASPRVLISRDYFERSDDTFKESGSIYCNYKWRPWNKSTEEVQTTKGHDLWKDTISIDLDTDTGRFEIGYSLRAATAQYSDEQTWNYPSPDCGSTRAKAPPSDIHSVSWNDDETEDVDGRFDPKHPDAVHSRVVTHLGDSTTTTVVDLTLVTPKKR